jgi:hypothetical protein
MVFSLLTFALILILHCRRMCINHVLTRLTRQRGWGHLGRPQSGTHACLVTTSWAFTSRTKRPSSCEYVLTVHFTSASSLSAHIFPTWS